MSRFRRIFFALPFVVCLPLLAQPAQPPESQAQPRAADAVRRGDAWIQQLDDRARRGTLHDGVQSVRGDSGRWQDEPLLIHAPAIPNKPPRLPLDDWAERLLASTVRQSTDADDNWLLIRTRQLDDNDRVWVQRIERQGNRFTVVVSEAVWQGNYFKNFTYYQLLGVNLGKLDPGEYQVTCVLKPLVFRRFEGTGQPKDNWPKDEQPAETPPLELRTTFRVGAKR